MLVCETEHGYSANMHHMEVYIRTLQLWCMDDVYNSGAFYIFILQILNASIEVKFNEISTVRLIWADKVSMELFSR